MISALFDAVQFRLVHSRWIAETQLLEEAAHSVLVWTWLPHVLIPAGSGRDLWFLVVGLLQTMKLILLPRERLLWA